MEHPGLFPPHYQGTECGCPLCALNKSRAPIHISFHLNRPTGTMQSIVCADSLRCPPAFNWFYTWAGEMAFLTEKFGKNKHGIFGLVPLFILLRRSYPRGTLSSCSSTPSLLQAVLPRRVSYRWISEESNATSSVSKFSCLHMQAFSSSLHFIINKGITLASICCLFLS